MATGDFRVTTETVKTWVGTSGFSYPAWRGSFYPERMPPGKMLGYYAERLDTVEINNTFYRMPKADMLAGWAASTPDGFRFAPKAPQQITHRQKLVDVADNVAYFFRALSAFGPKLGPVLFQLPPFLRKDLQRLVDFLALVPGEVRVALEFRHASWLDDAVYSALRERDAALCIADAEDFATPLVATASWGYLRLRREDYDDAALAAWAAKLSGMSSGWKSAYVYFKHEDAGLGPKLAAEFVAKLASSGELP